MMCGEPRFARDVAEIGTLGLCQRVRHRHRIATASASSLRSRLLTQALQEISELAFGRLLQLIEFRLLPLRIGRAARIAIRHHQVVVRRFAARLQLHRALQQVTASWIALGLGAQLRHCDQSLREIGTQFDGALKVRRRLGEFALRLQDLRDLYSATASEGFNASSASNSLRACSSAAGSCDCSSIARPRR